jgi:hypothetical protein
MREGIVRGGRGSAPEELLRIAQHRQKAGHPELVNGAGAGEVIDEPETTGDDRVAVLRTVAHGL